MLDKDLLWKSGKGLNALVVEEAHPQPTKTCVLHYFRVFWQSPRACKFVVKPITLLCWGRGHNRSLRSLA